MIQYSLGGTQNIIIYYPHKPVINPDLLLFGLRPCLVTAETVTKYSVSGSKYCIKKLLLEVVKLKLQPISLDLVTQSK